MAETRTDVPTTAVTLPNLKGTIILRHTETGVQKN